MRLRSLPEEFEQIFHQHRRLVYRTAYRVTGRAEDAEDVLQTVFLRLLRCESLDGSRQNPKAYLYRAAVNVSLDVVRLRRRVIPTDQLESIAPGGTHETQTGMRDALAEMSPKAAELLILRHVHGYTDVEIAKFLGTSRATVAVRSAIYSLRSKRTGSMSFGGRETSRNHSVSNVPL